MCGCNDFAAAATQLGDGKEENRLKMPEDLNAELQDYFCFSMEGVRTNHFNPENDYFK
jgi:hypothetical protein